MKGRGNMISLENDKLKVDISPYGAEVKRIYHAEYGLDYLWNSNPKYWGKSSPILFPIVGRLAENKYLLNGKEYSMNQHGFAQHFDFDVLTQTDTNVWFELKANDETLKQYPFEFSLKVGYELVDETLEVKWEVANLGEETMPFSIGGHPAFSTKLQEDDEFSDYCLHLEASEGVYTYDFNDKTGLVSNEKIEIIEKLKWLPLTKELFEEYPTLILDEEIAITLRSYNHDREVEVDFKGFPYVGIWSPITREGKISDFICIEPWYGIADTVSKPQELSEKKGIQLLESGSKFEASYTMAFK